MRICRADFCVEHSGRDSYSTHDQSPQSPQYHYCSTPQLNWLTMRFPNACPTTPEPTISKHCLPPAPALVLFTLIHTSAMGVEFGSFNSICQTAALIICPLIGSEQGIEPTCYSRNVDVGGTLIFQPCE